LVAGEKYSVAWRHNARNNNTPTVRVSVDTTVRELAVTPVGGTAAYQSGTVEFVATNTSAVLRLEQIADGDQTVMLDDIRVTGVVVEPLPNLLVGPSRIELGPGSQALAAITVSARRLQAGAATVKVRLADDTVARLVDADATGIVTLVFDQGLPQTTLTTAIEGVGRGSTILEVVENGGHDGVDGSVIINGTTSYVVNPMHPSRFSTTGSFLTAIRWPSYKTAARWCRPSADSLPARGMRCKRFTMCVPAVEEPWR
jgi:hypothetical protein